MSTKAIFVFLLLGGRFFPCTVITWDKCWRGRAVARVMLWLMQFKVHEKLMTEAMSKVRLYILFSQYRSCDDTQEIWSFVLFIKNSIFKLAFILFNEQDKGSNLPSIITWSVLGKQNVQAKKVYSLSGMGIYGVYYDDYKQRKRKTNNWGKCLALPVTSYGPGALIRRPGFYLNALCPRILRCCTLNQWLRTHSMLRQFIICFCVYLNLHEFSYSSWENIPC